MDALLARQEDIDRQIIVNQAKISTASRVLVDILSKIFTIYVRDFGGSPYDVAMVCRMWRSTALHHAPGIWGRILVVVPQVTIQSSWEDGFFVCSSPGALEKGLERRKDKKISLRLTNATPSGSINLSDLLPYRRIFEDSKQCWESFDIEFPTIIDDASDKAGGVTAATLIAGFIRASTSLRHLKLTSIDLKEATLAVPFTLETLTLTRCQVDLSKCDYPALIELHFDSSSTASNLIVIPNLRLLRYRGPTLTSLMQIAAPSLQKLDLASFDDPTWLDGGWEPRLNPQVLILRAGEWSEAVLKAFLVWMSNIESLDIETTTSLTAVEILEELEQGEMVSLEDSTQEEETGGDSQRPVTCPKLNAVNITVQGEICGDCISQLRSLSMLVLKKYSRVPVLRLKFTDGTTEEISSRDN